jgi:hypothetical protein
VNQQNNIFIELKELSPIVAGIPRVNVFTVPEGYFETLPALLLLEAGKVGGDFNQNSDVPPGYFDGLASNIMARIKADNIMETTAIPGNDAGLLAGIGNKNVYSVPDGYFDGLSTAISNRIKTESSGTVLSETNNISSLVAGIGNTNVFTVPDGYFDKLAGSISRDIAQTGKVVRMTPRKTILRYAAAAVVSGIIATSAFFIFNNDTRKTGELNAIVMKEAASIINNKSFDKELASLNDADIVNFLEAKGQDVEAALVASLAEDDKALPEAEDYLINENTLDEVLKDLDLNN